MTKRSASDGNHFVTDVVAYVMARRPSPSSPTTGPFEGITARPRPSSHPVFALRWISP